MKKIADLNVPLITALITALPIYGYFVAFTYEFTILSGLGVPLEFVQISLNSVFGIIILLSLASMVIFGVYTLARALVRKYKNKVFIYPLIVGVITIFTFNLISYIFMPDYSKELFKWGLVFSGIMVISEYSKPIYKFRTIRNYKANILALRKKNKSNKNNKVTLKKNSYLELALIFFLVFIITFLITSELANAYLSNLNNYLVFKKNGIDYALLRNFGEEKLAIKYVDSRLQPGKLLIFSSEELSLENKKLKLETKNRKSSYFLLFYRHETSENDKDINHYLNKMKVFYSKIHLNSLFNKYE